MKLGLLETPPLNELVAELASRHAAGTPRWPHGKTFAACLTHDVDCIIRLSWQERARRVRELRGQASWQQSARWTAAAAAYAVAGACGLADAAPYDAYVAEEERRGFHSTFFVLPERPTVPTVHDPCYRYGEAVSFRGHRMPFREATRRVRAGGWEIGLHGSYASGDVPEHLQAEKRQVEEMAGAPVVAARQHYLRFAHEATLAGMWRAGLAVDSTLGFSTTVGWRSGLAFPYFWPLEEGDVLEIPLTIQDIGLWRHGHRRLDTSDAIEHARGIIRSAATAGGLVTLSWHTHPNFPGAVACYSALLETVADLGGWGCSVGELDAWWRGRREAVVRHELRSSIGMPERRAA